MTSYILAFRAPRDYQPGDPDAVVQWQEFFQQIEPQVEVLGNPVFSRGSVGHTGEDTLLSGYTLIRAESLEEAMALAGDCPLIATGGGVEVGQIAPLDPETMTVKREATSV
jgi:hypothetical protein